MNALRTRLLRRNTLWLTLTGLVLGGLAATFIYTVEKPVFESTAVCRPLRPASDSTGIPHREWLNTEVAAMGSQENLLTVTRNLNLAREWRSSEIECVQTLKERLDISVVPDAALVRISTRGQKNDECAAVVNAVVDAREQHYRMEQDHVPDTQARELSSRASALADSCAIKRAALLAGLKAMNIPVSATDDASLMALTIPKLLADARAEWQADVVRLAETKAAFNALIQPLRLQPYAETLERGVASPVPVAPVWTPRAASWTIIGGVTGLALAVLLAISRREQSAAGSRPPALPPQPLAAGEY